MRNDPFRFCEIVPLIRHCAAGRAKQLCRLSVLRAREEEVRLNFHFRTPICCQFLQVSRFSPLFLFAFATFALTQRPRQARVAGCYVQGYTANSFYIFWTRYDSIRAPQVFSVSCFWLTVDLLLYFGNQWVNKFLQMMTD